MLWCVIAVVCFKVLSQITILYTCIYRDILGLDIFAHFYYLIFFSYLIRLSIIRNSAVPTLLSSGNWAALYQRAREVDPSLPTTAEGALSLSVPVTTPVVLSPQLRSPTPDPASSTPSVTPSSSALCTPSTSLSDTALYTPTTTLSDRAKRLITRQATWYALFFIHWPKIFHYRLLLIMLILI